MPEIWTAEEVAQKADWEGGLDGLFSWGGPDRIVKVEGVPDAEWNLLREAWSIWDAARERIMALLPEPSGDA